MSLREIRWMRVDNGSSNLHSEQEDDDDRAKERTKSTFWTRLREFPDRPTLSTILKYHIVDWIGLVFLLLLLLLLVRTCKPFPRQVPPNDPSLSYPLTPSTVPIWMLVIFSTLLPLFVFVFHWISSSNSRNHSLLTLADTDLLHASLGMCQALIFAVFLTTFLKVLAGRPRPNYYALCEYDQDKESCQTDDQHQMMEASVSYPSGHASFAFAGLFYLTLYLLGKMRLTCSKSLGVWDKPLRLENSNLEHGSKLGLLYSLLRSSQIGRVYLSVLPSMLACWIAVSRTRDYWHSFSDINAGSLIGCLCAYFSYRLRYHSVFHSRLSHYPLVSAEAAGVSRDTPMQTVSVSSTFDPASII